MRNLFFTDTNSYKNCIVIVRELVGLVKTAQWSQECNILQECFNGNSDVCVGSVQQSIPHESVAVVF